MSIHKEADGLFRIRWREQGRTTPFLRTKFHEFYGQFSPDGKWIAYRDGRKYISGRFLLQAAGGRYPTAEVPSPDGAATEENCSTWPVET